jgi:hypothetical protein
MNITARISNEVFLRKDLFSRWIIVTANSDLAWSGSQWVAVGGNVQISNFDLWEEAATYAESFGFVVIGRLE